MGGTIKSPETRVTANDVVKSTENIKPVPEAQKAPVINQTKEELDNHEAKLTGSNLDKIGVSRSEALKLAQEVLNISNPFDITEFKNAIKKYQDEHNIGIDGKIGKETYYEMKAGDVFKECREVDEMIPYLKEILPNLTGKSQNSLLLKPVLDKLRKNPEFQQRLRTDIELNRVVINFEKKLNVYKNSPEGKKAYENAKTKFTDLHEVVNNPTPENIKNFVNDPTLLLAGGLLFLFGVGTDMSFMKRLGILLGGFIFGPYAMKKLGVGKFWDQLDESADHGTIDKAQKAASKASKETANWVTKNAKNAWGAITGFFGEAGDKIGELKLSDLESSFSKVSSKLESANKSKDKSEQIKEESLKNLTGVLLSDKIFVNLTKEDLEEINKDNINQYLTAESQEKLTKEDKGVIKKYIVLLSEQFQTGDTRVRDLLLTTEMVDKIKEAYYKTDTEFVPEAKTFNDEINKLIKSLLATPDKEKHFAALQLAKALKDGDVSKFDINSFKLGDYETDVKSVIDVFNEYKNIYTPAIEQLEKIDISDDDKKAFKYDYDLFIGVSKTEIKDSELKADFEKKIFEKKLEIFKKAQELGINKLKDETGKEVVVDDYLEGLEEEKKKIDIIKEINELQITESVPTKNDSPKKFKAWYDKYEENFKKAEEILADTSIDQKVKDKAQKILDKKNLFKGNYEKLRDKYKTKIDNIKTDLTNLDTQTNFNKKLEGINKIKQDYNNLLKELNPNLTEKFKGFLDKVKDKIKGNFTIPEEENPIIYLDTEFSISQSLDFDFLGVDIAKKVLDVQKNYSVELKSTSISEKVKEANKHLEIINQFEELIREDKINELKEKVKDKILQPYIDRIDVATNDKEVKNIYTEYKQFVKGKLDSDLNDGSVDKNYEERMKNMKEIKQEKKLNDKLKKFNIDNKVIDQINKAEFMKENNFNKINYGINGYQLVNMLKAYLAIPNVKKEKDIRNLIKYVEKHANK